MTWEPHITSKKSHNERRFASRVCLEMTQKHCVHKLENQFKKLLILRASSEHELLDF